MPLRISIKLVLLFALFWGGITCPASAQHVAPDKLQLYVQNDTLRIDVAVDSLFTQRSRDAIESGMTASIAIQFRLLDSRNRTLAKIGHLARLEHDIWEGEYRLFRLHGKRDTLIFKTLDGVSRRCSNHQNIALIAVPFPNSTLRLQTRIKVDPISPEQQERTRRWLRILRKGSLLEFFFSFENRQRQSRWQTVVQFHPNALPHLVSEERP